MKYGISVFGMITAAACLAFSLWDRDANASLGWLCAMLWALVSLINDIERSKR